MGHRSDLALLWSSFEHVNIEIMSTYIDLDKFSFRLNRSLISAKALTSAHCWFYSRGFERALYQNRISVLCLEIWLRCIGGWIGKNAGNRQNHEKSFRPRKQKFLHYCLINAS
jgi:hypothetical protein